MIKTEILLNEAFACGYSTRSAAQLAKVSLKEAEDYYSNNVEAIAARQQELKDTIGILNPVRRLEMLNKVANMGMDGIMVFNKKGEPVTVQQPSVSVQAIKVANEMLAASETVTVTNTSGSEETILRKAYSDIREDVESDEEAWKVLKKGFPEHKELVEELIAKSAV